MRRIKKITFYFVLILLISGNIIAQTTTNLKNPGDVWMYHNNPVWVEEEFIIEVHLNSGKQKLSAYGFYLPYDNSLIEVNSSYGNMGVVAGPDGFITATSPAEGEVLVSGYDASGTGPGEDLHIATVYFRAIQTGSTLLDFDVDDASDDSGQLIGTPNGMNSSIEIVRSYIKLYLM